jgi:transcriptional regulator with XRE-family HTH domain
MQDDINIKIKQQLRQARSRCGLEQKQVAYLLEKNGPSQISRYESGERLPSLITALKLGIIYHTPVRILFQALYEQFQSEINERRKKLKNFFPPENPFPGDDNYPEQDYCFYAEMLKDRKPDAAEKRLITKHVVELMKATTASDSDEAS